MSNTYIIGVTGHRDLIESGYDLVSDSFEQLILKILENQAVNQIQVLTGLAEGADQLITRLCLALGNAGINITPTAVLPMPMQQYLKDFSHEALFSFNNLIQELKERNAPIIELPVAASRMNSYENLGQYLLNQSDLLVSIWDGNYKTDIGGTCQVTLAALVKSNNTEKSRATPLVYRIYGKRISSGSKADTNTDTGMIQGYKDRQLIVTKLQPTIKIR